MIRDNVVEKDGITMFRILNGLNRDITNTVKLEHYMDELVHLGIKLEK